MTSGFAPFHRKSAADLAAMRRAGRVVAEILAACESLAAPGGDVAALAVRAQEILDRRGAKASFDDFGFSAPITVSRGAEVLYGTPAGTFSDGDLVCVDAACAVDGLHADAAASFVVGDVEAGAPSRRLVDAVAAALDAGIRALAGRGRLGDVSAAVQRAVEAAGFSVVREYVGHGIGSSLHEEPQLPNWGEAGTGMRVVPGMCVAIEPIAVAGSPELATAPDGRTVVTVDGSLAAHAEHTVAVTPNGIEILTAR